MELLMQSLWKPLLAMALLLVLVVAGLYAASSNGKAQPDTPDLVATLGS